MHNTSKRAFTLLLFVAMFIAGVVILAVSFFTSGEEWAMQVVNQHLYRDGRIISSGRVLDDNGEILAQTVDGNRVYNSDSSVRRSVLHAVGDTNGSISTGVQNLYQTELNGYSIVNGVYYLKQNNKGNDIHLSLKANVCKTAYEALNGRKGTVGVYNYKEGNIVCMVSAPTFDPQNVPDEETIKSSSEYEGVFLNRFLSGTYTPGSTFKVVTSASAILNIPDIYTRTFNCTGRLSVTGSNDGVKCSGVHGTENFSRSLNNSCNVAFGSIAIELGRDRLQKTAEDLGLTSSFEVDRVAIAKGNIDFSKAVDIDMGWAGIGQYTVMTNPCMMMTLMGAIANNGKAIKPYFVKNINSASGKTLYSASKDTVDEINMSSDLASQLKELLRSDVKDYYGDYSFPGLTMCGKTGTAEVGQNKANTSLFVGFSYDESFPYAVVVVVEEAGASGMSVAIPIANRVLQTLR